MGFHQLLIILVLGTIVHTIPYLGSAPLYILGYALFVLCVIATFMSLFFDIWQKNQEDIRAIQLSVTDTSNLPEYVHMQKSTIDEKGFLFLIILFSPFLAFIAYISGFIAVMTTIFIALGIFSIAAIAIEGNSGEVQAA